MAEIELDSRFAQMGFHGAGHLRIDPPAHDVRGHLDDGDALAETL